LQRRAAAHNCVAFVWTADILAECRANATHSIQNTKMWNAWKNVERHAQKNCTYVRKCAMRWAIRNEFRFHVNNFFKNFRKKKTFKSFIYRNATRVRNLFWDSLDAAIPERHHAIWNWCKWSVRSDGRWKYTLFCFSHQKIITIISYIFFYCLWMKDFLFNIFHRIFVCA
jgi:hypothetical protein